MVCFSMQRACDECLRGRFRHENAKICPAVMIRRVPPVASGHRGYRPVTGGPRYLAGPLAAGFL